MHFFQRTVKCRRLKDTPSTPHAKRRNRTTRGRIQDAPRHFKPRFSSSHYCNCSYIRLSLLKTQFYEFIFIFFLMFPKKVFSDSGCLISTVTISLIELLLKLVQVFYLLADQFSFQTRHLLAIAQFSCICTHCLQNG